MNTNNLYINAEQFFNRAKEERLLIEDQINVLQICALQVDHIFLDYFVPVSQVDDAIKYCREKIEYYRSLGSIDKMDCYNDFINMLKCLSIEAEEY